MNLNNIICFDLETDSKYPKLANPVQIAGIIIDPRKLEQIKGAEFNSGCRPDDIDKPEYFEEHKSTIEFHARLQKCTGIEVVEKWKTYPSEKIVWGQFIDFLAKYNTGDGKRKSKFNACIPGGANIMRYDLVITQRLCEKYGNTSADGEQNIFHPRDCLDTLHSFCFPWFEAHPDPPESYSMDNLRPYLGIQAESAHDALSDVRDSAKIITKFLKFHRKLRETHDVKFRGSFANV